jgi:hypothetical protein
MTLAGTPTATLFESIALLANDEAPKTEKSPTVTFCRMVELVSQQIEISNSNPTGNIAPGIDYISVSNNSIMSNRGIQVENIKGSHLDVDCKNTPRSNDIASAKSQPITKTFKGRMDKIRKFKVIHLLAYLTNGSRISNANSQT